MCVSSSVCLVFSFEGVLLTQRGQRAAMLHGMTCVSLWTHTSVDTRTWVVGCMAAPGAKLQRTGGKAGPRLSAPFPRHGPPAPQCSPHALLCQAGWQSDGGQVRWCDLLLLIFFDLPSCYSRPVLLLTREPGPNTHPKAVSPLLRGSFLSAAHGTRCLFLATFFS